MCHTLSDGGRAGRSGVHVQKRLREAAKNLCINTIGERTGLLCKLSEKSVWRNIFRRKSKGTIRKQSARAEGEVLLIGLNRLDQANAKHCRSELPSTNQQEKVKRQTREARNAQCSWSRANGLLLITKVMKWPLMRTLKKKRIYSVEKST